MMLCLGEDLAIDQLISVERDAILGRAAARAVPGVVDADKNAEHVGLNIKRIDLPALLEIGDAVAANATVVDRQLAAG